MQFKSIQAIRGGRVISITLPDKKSIVFCGSTNDNYYVMDLMRVMFGVDYNDNLGHLKYRAEEILKNNASLRFTTGSIYINKGSVRIDGRIPYLHIVQPDNHGGIRSYLVSQSVSVKDLDVDMTHYNESIPHTDWIRLAELFNRYAERECVEIIEVGTNESGAPIYELRFNDITEELQTVWLLMSESFLTPQNYLRIVLLPELDGFDGDSMFRLIDLVDNISRLEMVITTAEVNIKAGSVITEVNF